MSHKTRLPTCAALAATLLSVMPCAALAATADGLPAEKGRYDECIAAIEINPEQAFEEALIWRDQGGGDPAEHCVAIALLAMGYVEEAAVRLDTLARENRGGTQEMRSDLMLQAGDAWLLSRRADLAEASFSAALMLTPREADVWAARGRVQWKGSGRVPNPISMLQLPSTMPIPNFMFFVLPRVKA